MFVLYFVDVTLSFKHLSLFYHFITTHICQNISFNNLIQFSYQATIEQYLFCSIYFILSETEMFQFYESIESVQKDISRKHITINFSNPTQSLLSASACKVLSINIFRSQICHLWGFFICKQGHLTKRQNLGHYFLSETHH